MFMFSRRSKRALAIGLLAVVMAGCASTGPRNPRDPLEPINRAMFTFNEVWWYSVVSLFFGAGPVRTFYLRAKSWIDRVTGVFLGGLGLRLLWGVAGDTQA